MSTRAIASALALAGVLTCVPSVAAAQAVLAVGPSRQFIDVQPAVNAAQPGDILLIDDGSYGQVTIGKELTLRARVTTAGVPLGVSILSMSVNAGPVFVDSINLRFSCSVTSATATLTNCTFDGPVFGFDAKIDLTACGVAAFGGVFTNAALIAMGTTSIAAVDCSFVGLTAGSGGGPAGVLATQSSTLQLSHCTLQGGPSLKGILGPGLFVGVAARAWLSDCTITGAGNIAIRSNNSEPVRIARCQVRGNIVGNVQNVPLVGISTPTPFELLRGGATLLSLRTEPGAPIGVQIAFALGTPADHPLLAEPGWGFLAASQPWSLQLADASGAAQVAIAVPAVPALEHLRVWFGAWSCVRLPVSVSPPLGGIVR